MTGFVTAIFLATSCGDYIPTYCLIDPAQYGAPRTERGCHEAAWSRGWDGGPITCVEVRIRK